MLNTDGKAKVMHRLVRAVEVPSGVWCEPYNILDDTQYEVKRGSPIILPSRSKAELEKEKEVNAS